jgi:hypothetical protein
MADDNYCNTGLAQHEQPRNDLFLGVRLILFHPSA